MLSDPDHPVFYVYVEPDEEGIQPSEIMQEYVELVKSLINEQAMLSS